MSNICEEINSLSPEESEQFISLMQIYFCNGLVLDRRYELLSDYLEKNDIFYLGSDDTDYFYNISTKKCFSSNYASILGSYGYFETLYDICITGNTREIHGALTTLYNTCRDVSLYNSFLDSIPFEKVDIQGYYRVLGRFRDRIWVETEQNIEYFDEKHPSKRSETFKIA